MPGSSSAERRHTAAGRARGVAAAAVLAGYLALLVVLDRLDLNPSVYRVAPGGAQIAVYAIVAAAALAAALATGRVRRAILVGASLVVLPVALGWWAVVPVAYVAGVIAVARTRLPVPAKLALALAAWLAVPIVRVGYLDGAGQAETVFLAVVWAGLLYAAFYLIVDRARALPGEHPRVLDDVFYLLAPPRLIVPFFQPIAPRDLRRGERAHYPAKLVAHGAGLALYGAGVAVAAHWLDAHAAAAPHHALVLGARFVAAYLRMTYTIFLAIAVYRLLGFQLGSGFKYPLLSRSFPEFFRRFNHYVRDAVLSLFYFPLLGALRGTLSARVASIISAYVAILVGSFLLHDLLVPVAIAAEPGAVAVDYLHWPRVLSLLLLWSLIILPNAGIAPRREPPASRAYAAYQVVQLNVIYFGLWWIQTQWRP